MQTTQTSHALLGWTSPHATCSCTYTFTFVLRLHAPTSLIHIIQTTTQLSLIELLSILNSITFAESFSPESQIYELPHCCRSIICIELHPGGQWVRRWTNSMLTHPQKIVHCKAWNNNHLLLFPLAVRYPFQNLPTAFQNPKFMFDDIAEPRMSQVKFLLTR